MNIDFLGIRLMSAEEKAAQKERIKLVQTYQIVFGSPEGREVLHDLCRRTGVFNATFDEDTGKLFYKSGRQAVGLEILSMLRMDTTAMLKLLEEKHDNRERPDRAERDD